MVLATRLVLFVFFCTVSTGCIKNRTVRPDERVLDVGTSSANQLSNIVLTKHVAVNHVTKNTTIFGLDMTSDAATTSKFGKKDDVANLSCIVAGINSVLMSVHIIPAAEFWGVLRSDKGNVSLDELFHEPYYSAIKNLEMDYIVAAYHSLMDIDTNSWEFVFAGQITDENREISSAAVIDVSNKSVVNAVQVTGEHVKSMMHVYIVFPFYFSKRPAEDPCEMVGRQVAEEMSHSLLENKILRIAVVAAAENPYTSLASGINTSSDGDNISITGNTNISKEAGIYCPNADLGHDDAQAYIGDLYYLGAYSIDQDLIKAYVWYSLAADKGNTYAAQQVKKLEADLSPTQLNNAKYQLIHWEPGHCKNDLLDSTIYSHD